ncbi:hypothetical protein M2322_003305 [Rhodoblastus acidophilus]|nr:hypothetical protein [Rhodoblastus acidophilus]
MKAPHIVAVIANFLESPDRVRVRSGKTRRKGAREGFTHHPDDFGVGKRRSPSQKTVFNTGFRQDLVGVLGRAVLLETFERARQGGDDAIMLAEYIQIPAAIEHALDVGAAGAASRQDDQRPVL